MTVDEMRNKIREECSKRELCTGCPLYGKVENNCWTTETTINQIKENYELMFGKEESEMKNEFDFNELKIGWAIKLPSGSFCVGMQTDEDEITFFERFENGELSAVCTKEDIINNKCENENKISFYPIEVYGYSETNELFDPSTRPLIWKKENMNQKIYKINNIIIEPNYKDGYKYEEPHAGSIYINRKEDDYFYSIPIKKSELDDVINALTEIRDFIKEED